MFVTGTIFSSNLYLLAGSDTRNCLAVQVESFIADDSDTTTELFWETFGFFLSFLKFSVHSNVLVDDVALTRSAALATCCGKSCLIDNDGLNVENVVWPRLQSMVKAVPMLLRLWFYQCP